MKKKKILLAFAIVLLGVPVHAQESTAKPAYDIPCLLEPTETVEVSSPVSGVIRRITVRRGDLVKKGQVIAQLDTRTERAALDLSRVRANSVGQVQTAQRKIEFARKKYQRVKQMASQGLLSKQEADDVEAELKLAEADLVTAQENRKIAYKELKQRDQQLILKTIRSPFNGAVVEKKLTAGELTETSGAKKAIVTLARIHPLQARIVLQSSSFGRLKAGDQVELTPDYESAPTINAKVTRIDRVIDAASGTFAVFLRVPNPQNSIPAGVTCKVAF